MVSIRQDVYPDFLPDFRNLGVVARVLVGLNLAALAAAALGAESPARAAERFIQSAGVFEPLLLASVALLSAFSSLLARLPYWIGWSAVLVLVLALALGEHAAFLWLGLEPPELWRTVALSMLTTVCLLYYLRLVVKAYSPALAEARLQALQARIRPHFLFNSLNAVLSLIRRDPKRAERALEDLADMFRTLMSDGIPVPNRPDNFDSDEQAIDGCKDTAVKRDKEWLLTVLENGPQMFPTPFTRQLAGRNGWSHGHAHVGRIAQAFAN